MPRPAAPRRQGRGSRSARSLSRRRAASAWLRVSSPSTGRRSVRLVSWKNARSLSGRMMAIASATEEILASSASSAAIEYIPAKSAWCRATATRLECLGRGTAFAPLRWRRHGRRRRRAVGARRRRGRCRHDREDLGSGPAADDPSASLKEPMARGRRFPHEPAGCDDLGPMEPAGKFTAPGRPRRRC